MKLPTIHQVPFLRFLLPMIVGIVIYSRFSMLWIGYLFAFLASLCFFVSYITQQSRHAFRLRYLFGVGIFLSFIFIGFTFTHLQNEKSKFDFPSKRNLYNAEIKSVPEEKEKSIYCQLTISHCDNQTKETQAKKIIAYIHKDVRSLQLKQGDYLLIYIEPQALVNANRPGGFDFAAYMQRQGISSTAYIDSAYWKKLPKERAFNLNYFASDLQSKILTIFRSFQFKENEFALLSGITIGYQDALTMEQKSNFSAVGLSHLMAVSGMQTAMIFAMFWFLLGFIPKNSRFYQLKYLVVILALWIFTYITGLSASVVRASIMLTVLMVSGLFNRQTVTLNSLAFAAFCLLLYNPLTLYDIGFQLSFLAVLSILLTQDILKTSFENMPKVPRYFAELATMTLAAQLATSPLSIFYFHQFPLLFLIVNLIVLPFNGFLVYLACLCTFLVVVGIPHFWFDKLLQWMLFGLDKVTETFAQVPYAQIRNLNPTSFEILLFYILLGCILLFVYKKHFKMVLYALSTLVCIEGTILFDKLNERQQNQLLIYNQYGKSVIEYQKSGKTYLSDGTNHALAYGGKRIFVLDKDIRNIENCRILNCDYLILTKGFKGDIEKLNSLYSYKEVIFDTSLGRFYANKLGKDLEELNLSFHDMTKKGAFIQSINQSF
ncbi:MAG: ComEC/Rec2 family competence protein [Bacteroidales bacterium]